METTPTTPVPVSQPETTPSPAPSGAPVAAQVPSEPEERFFAAIGYFGPLFVLPLIVKPKSDFCRFHAKQSMILLLVTFVVSMILFMISSIGSLLTMALFAVYILAIYRAYKGDIWKIPVVGSFAEKINLHALYSKAGTSLGSVAGLKEAAQTLADKTGDAMKSLGNQEEEKKEEPKAPENKPQ